MLSVKDLVQRNGLRSSRKLCSCIYQDFQDFRKSRETIPWAVVLLINWNDMKRLKQILEELGLVNVVKLGFLHFSCEIQRIEPFRYLLEVHRNWLEIHHYHSPTFADDTFQMCLRENFKCDEAFPIELIQNNAVRKDKGFVHMAIQKSYYKLAIVLIEKGFDFKEDLNGRTVLEIAIEAYFEDNEQVQEVIIALIISRAEVSFEHFLMAVRRGVQPEIQELIFMHVCDEFFEYEVDILSLFLIAEKAPQFLERIMQLPVTFVNQLAHLDECERYWCRITESVLRRPRNNDNPRLFLRKPGTLARILDLQILDVLLQHKSLLDLVLSFIEEYTSRLGLFDIWMMNNDETEEALTCYLCYFYSYGVKTADDELHLIYRHFGNCKLFKMLQHMEPDVNRKSIVDKMLYSALKLDATLNLNDCLKKQGDYSFCENLPKYFRHPRGIRIPEMLRLNIEEEQEENVKKVPSLLQLSRDAFRSHFVKTFQIKNRPQFNKLLKDLSIPDDYKEIINYEREIYT